MWSYCCPCSRSIVSGSFRNARLSSVTANISIRAYARKSQIKQLSEAEIRSSFAERNDQLKNGQTDIQSNDRLYPLLQTVRQSTIPLLRIPDIKSKWDNESTIHTDDIPQTDLIQVNGRIKSIRRSGKKLIFIDLLQDFDHIQIVLNCRKLSGFNDDVEKFINAHHLLRRGDIITTVGKPWRTKSGEFSILASHQATLLSPCLHPLPTTELNDTTRLHNRVVDLAVNQNSRNIILARSTILSNIRKFFEDRDFIEVQTPILSTQSGGATAEPFLTESRVLGKSENEKDSDSSDNTTLAMRIAPELWLKRLVVSGFDKVFEIGQCFRNEGIDASHNPEFTSCEFYQSYTTLEELISITQQLLYKVVLAVQTKHPDLESKEILNRLAVEFNDNNKLRQIDFISEIEKLTEKKLPIDLGNREELIAYYNSLDIPIPKSSTPLTAAKLLDNLAGVLIEPQCSSPTFIINHPHIMSPLAKSTTVNINGIPRRISRRFELFINSREYANAYEEENNPFIQKENFLRQAYDNITLKDSESPLPDHSYISAMEWGLPPTGGWGLGIDRLCMLLTGAERISQVLTFGTVKTVNYQ